MVDFSMRKHPYSSKSYQNTIWLNRNIKFNHTLCSMAVTFILMFELISAAFIDYGNPSQKSIDSRKYFLHSSSANRVIREENDLETSDVCLTPECENAATEILRNMNETIDPCDNFYKFACGGWIANHSIPDHMSQLSVIHEVMNEMNLNIKELLDNQLNGSEPNSFKMVKKVYDACMDFNDIDNSGSAPLQKLLQILGGWPVVVGDTWNESNFDWMDTLFVIRKFGFDEDILLKLSVTEDLRNNTVHIIDLDETSLGMSDRKYFIEGLNDSFTQAYFNLMIKTAKKLGANEQTVENELREALNFEIALANYSLPREERRNVSALYNKFTIVQLQELVPEINWLKYFNGLLNDSITTNETLNVCVPLFLQRFGQLITITDKRVVANYMIWRVVKDSLKMLSEDWRALEQEYLSVTEGSNQTKPRWEQCISFLTEKLGIPLSAYYVKHYFKSESKDKAEDLVKYLRRSFLEILETTYWMGNETKKQAKEKAEAITPYIGYPQELLNDSLVMGLYENLTITNESYFDYMLSLNKWSADYFFSYLRKPNIKGEWSKHAKAAVVNAFYNHVENGIVFPAGILQNVFFNKDRPNYMNFGAIGFVIGHEITHGFDDQGRQFDKDGNNTSWWDDTTDKRFREKAECIIQQYGNYTAENGLQLNGINTQGENIADNGGLKEAYLAYHTWVNEHGEEKKLPGLNYTTSQLFWISAANVWCGKDRTEVLKNMITSHNHSPFEFRIIGTVSNLNEFANDFNCPAGSPMNPHKKCQVW